MWVSFIESLSAVYAPVYEAAMDLVCVHEVFVFAGCACNGVLTHASPLCKAGPAVLIFWVPATAGLMRKKTAPRIRSRGNPQGVCFVFSCSLDLSMSRRNTVFSLVCQGNFRIFFHPGPSGRRRELLAWSRFS